MRIDLTEIGKPKFTRPELLRHPHIPKPLHGIAPRVVKGSEWWDEIRHKAYRENNMRCWACGGEGPLEAHEAYDIDYETKTSTYVETVALCRDCHAFIHSGRTSKVTSRGDLKRVITHGYRVLKAAGLKCPWTVRVIPTIIDCSPGWLLKAIDMADPIPLSPKDSRFNLRAWVMIFEGKEYK